MAALTPSVPSWIPEDDLLLKNAVEAGASLEALAKGAVRFSRKFTVGELRDRWHSLLYDPDVSDKASAQMLHFQLSAPNVCSNFDKSAKRKIQSVRQMYYAMRKKTCAPRPCNSPNPSFLGTPSASDCIGFGGGGCSENVAFSSQSPGGCVNCQSGFTRKGCYDRLSSFNQDHSPKFRLVEFQNCNEVAPLAVPESSPSFDGQPRGFLSPVPRMALWDMIDDVSVPEMTISASVEDKASGEEETFVHDDAVDGNGMCSTEVNVVQLGSMLQEMHGDDIPNSSTAIPDSLADLSDSLLNLSNEGETPFIDVDGKVTLDKSCYVNSLLVSSPNHVHDVACIAEEPQTLASDTSIRIPAGSCPVELGVITKESCSVGNLHGHSCAEIIPPSFTSARNTSSAELSDKEMQCVLNTEDPEIPFNDYFSNSKRFSYSAMKRTSKVTCFVSSSSTNQKDLKQNSILLTQEDNPSQLLAASQTVWQATLPVTSPSLQIFSSGVKCESSDRMQRSLVYRKDSNTQGDSSHHGSVQESPTSATVELLKSQSLHACNARDMPLHANVNSLLKTILVPGVEASTSNQEESESDNSIPSCSDIEAMILEMDLCPDDSGSCINGEVSRYRNEDTKRTIIRLEQCARSSMQRAIVSRGAFAIFYGRRLKHYIKETEVILGRATDDMDVDIDLGTEGPANKISRRQALIKMEGDGSFILKNLGKSIIFINGKDVATGHALSLRSSSLIEIREMAFVFEINSKSVRQYLANIAKSHHENNCKFEWSEEQVNDQDGNIKYERSEGAP